MASAAAVDAGVTAAAEIVAAEVTAAIDAGVSATAAAEAASDIAIYPGISASLDAAAENLEPILGRDITNVTTKLLGGMEFSQMLEQNLGADSEEFIKYLNNYSQDLPGTTVTAPTTTMLFAVRGPTISPESKDSSSMSEKDSKVVHDLIQFATKAATDQGRKNAAKDIIGPALEKAFRDAGYDTKHNYLEERKKKTLLTALIPFYGWGKAVAMLASLNRDAKNYMHSKAQHLVLDRIVHNKAFLAKVEDKYNLSLKLFVHSDEWKTKMEAARKADQDGKSEKADQDGKSEKADQDGKSENG